MQTETNSGNQAGAAALISLSAWVERVGVTACTVWRWRQKGWLQVTNICGRLYLSPEAIRAFNERAQRGEFAQVHKAPAHPLKQA
jgi:hypothetical protein